MKKPIFLLFGGVIVLLILANIFGIIHIEQNNSSNSQSTDKSKDTFIDYRVIFTENKKGIEGVGETNLPNGSIITLSLNVVNNPTEYYIGKTVYSEVINNKFLIQIDTPQRNEFMTGPYIVSALFTPMKQSEEVLKIVGDRGQNLSGPHKVENGKTPHFYTIEVNKTIEGSFDVSGLSDEL